MSYQQVHWDTRLPDGSSGKINFLKDTKPNDMFRFRVIGPNGSDGHNKWAIGFSARWVPVLVEGQRETSDRMVVCSDEIAAQLYLPWVGNKCVAEIEPKPRYRVAIWNWNAVSRYPEQVAGDWQILEQGPQVFGAQDGIQKYFANFGDPRGYDLNLMVVEGKSKSFPKSYRVEIGR